MSRGRGLLERLLARHREAAGDGVSDAELLRRFSRERDEAAFELLVWRHGEMVLGVCQRAVRDEQHAEDAFQAVFLVLARKAGAVRGNLGGWLFKVARRVAARAAVRQANAEPLQDLASGTQPDRAEQQELAALLDAEVARLPERLRKPVVLCYLGGRSTDDAAREIGCPRGTVLSRLATARKRLAARLAHRGVTTPAVLALGAGLTARTVFACVASAHTFRAGAHAISSATVLAEGVIQTMTRGTLLTTLGSAVLAVSLVSGVGWVAAQQGGKGSAPTEDTAAAPLLPPVPVAANAPPEPNPVDERAKKLDERQQKLEALANALKDEIAAKEKQLEMLAATTDKDAAQQAAIQKQFERADEELQRLNREIARMEAELTVLKKRLDAKPLPDPDAAAIQEIVAKDARVIKLRLALARAQDEVTKAVLNFANTEAPAVRALKAEVAKLELEHAAAQKQAADDAVAAVRAADKKQLRERIDKLAFELEIQQEVRGALRAERDTLAKAVARFGTATDLATLRKELAPQREALAKVQSELLALRLQQQGFVPARADTTDAKLDQLLREIAELRKEVRELKKQK